MIDLTKHTGYTVLALVLFAVCAAAAFLMAGAAALTAGPAAQRAAEEVNSALRQVLPDFDNDPASEAKTLKDAKGNELILYVARKDGKCVGYAAKAYTMSGYGGKIEGLLGFQLDGAIRKCLITSHHETPGIGTKVVDRTQIRTITQVLHGEGKQEGLPANEALDCYEGLKGSGDGWQPEQLHFISGATVSSYAVRELVWQTASAICKAQQEGKLEK